MSRQTDSYCQESFLNQMLSRIPQCFMQSCLLSIMLEKPFCVIESNARYCGVMAEGLFCIFCLLGSGESNI